MQKYESYRTLFSKPVFTNCKFIAFLWLGVVCAGLIIPVLKGLPNNYLIFKYAFYHTIDQVNLYESYPEYQDSNHYGLIFGLMMAPFAVLPDKLGFVLLGLFTSFCLFFAIYKLPIPWKWKAIIFYITLNDMFITTLACQTNTLIAALIIGSYIFIRKEKEFWAACLIALGFFLKIYGIAGFAFFFFSRHKIRFMAYLFFWSIIFFVLPMLISSSQFVVQSYEDWFHSLVLKNKLNIGSMLQDYSIMGMIRRITGNRDISNLIVLIPAVVVFAIQYLRTDLYQNIRFQLSLLAMTLISIVIFSSGSESPTYIIAMTGVGIWFVSQSEPRSKYAVFLLIFVFLSSSFATTDFMPHGVRLFIKTYALKALPCFLIWLLLVYRQWIGYNKRGM
jgi:hypothetical protein